MTERGTEIEVTRILSRLHHKATYGETVEEREKYQKGLNEAIEWLQDIFVKKEPAETYNDRVAYFKEFTLPWFALWLPRGIRKLPPRE